MSSHSVTADTHQNDTEKQQYHYQQEYYYPQLQPQPQPTTSIFNNKCTILNTSTILHNHKVIIKPTHQPTDAASVAASVSQVLQTDSDPSKSALPANESSTALAPGGIPRTNAIRTLPELYREESIIPIAWRKYISPNKRAIWKNFYAAAVPKRKSIV
ncbi:hypothetical protein BCR33DRAFT_780471 [Rhizoclosmatium globosum]|uniref:Uncharacterized protein n=1 Tax=Rhizoclosmatium globosum TaxID=329046 RepID=A0A1Y2CWV0_9FUNG|nr:hypothetical protein BCR33DRAFT_780471 [Rhizoclosmatium globosum]|eukprot:ORY51508.1 hypothetical protein BCR33DRAFT_780471 [Rhizoclosmatium globosum]